ncbi:23939_t:CDS:2, partial [Racocetra persica]
TLQAIEKDTGKDSVFFLCKLTEGLDMGGLIANTLVFVFPKSEKEKINNLSGLLKINDLFSETKKPDFTLTQANIIAKKMSPSFFDRILADIKNKRQAKQGGSGPGPGNPGSPGTPGGPGDIPDNGNGPTTPTPSKDKNDVPPPPEDEVENRFNNDPAKQQIENNQQLTEDEKQAALKLLKTLISAEILIEKGQFNQLIFDELLAEKNKQSTAHKTLNENERIDGVIESLKSLKQTSQNSNQPTQNKDEFPF